MKRLVLIFGILAMLTPSLACAGFYCCPPEQKETRSEEMPCHEQGKKNSPDVKFMKDCAKIDLQSVSDHVVLKKQTAQAHDLFIMAATIQPHPAMLVRENGIRAPPQGGPGNSFPPIYLSTQRLRI